MESKVHPEVHPPPNRPTDLHRGALRVFKREASNSRARSLLRFKAARMPPLLSLRRRPRRNPWGPRVKPTKNTGGVPSRTEITFFPLQLSYTTGWLFCLIINRGTVKYDGVYFLKTHFNMFNSVGCHPIYTPKNFFSMLTQDSHGYFQGGN